MNFQVGMIVEHPQMKDWGPGKIVAIQRGNLHVVFRDFDGRAAKKFSVSHSPLVMASLQSDPVLDHLPPLQEDNGSFVLPCRRITVQQAINSFLARFPRGFEDPAYLGDKKTGERNYKWSAHEEWEKLLGKGQARQLLDEKNFGELTRRALAVEGKVNLLSPYEKMALREAWKEVETSHRFFSTLLDLLEAERIERRGFETFAEAVKELPHEKGKARVATWPIATLFPFLAQPDRHLFLKPEVTQVAAERLAFNLFYDSSPNWKTYQALLEMGMVYRELIVALEPRDFIDVQSFIWVTCGGYND